MKIYVVLFLYQIAGAADTLENRICDPITDTSEDSAKNILRGLFFLTRVCHIKRLANRSL